MKIHGPLSLMYHLKVEKRVSLSNHEVLDHAFKDKLSVVLFFFDRTQATRHHAPSPSSIFLDGIPNSTSWPVQGHDHTPLLRFPVLALTSSSSSTSEGFSYELF
ncbi:hypothetical protein Tco_1444306 [Tanacetum coccineum]